MTRPTPTCPICYQPMISDRYRMAGIGPGNGLIHWCPTAQREPANEALAGDAECTQELPAQPAPKPAPLFSLVTP